MFQGELKKYPFNLNVNLHVASVPFQWGKKTQFCCNISE